MSEIITVWKLETDEFGTITFDKVAELMDFLKEEIVGCLCCVGDTLEFRVQQGEMQRHEYESLKELE